MPQQNTQVPGFPDPVGGRSKLQIIDHRGPALYVTGGETFPQQNAFGGPNSIGLSGVLFAQSGSVTEDGLYRLLFQFGGAGAVKGTVKVKWIVISTGAEAGAINLSGSFVRLLVIGG
jgi:hypothetical protein